MAGLAKLRCGVGMTGEWPIRAERVSGGDHVLQGRRVTSRAELTVDQAAGRKGLFRSLRHNTAAMRLG
ncbi:hypothetical protein DQW77_15735 [Roseovarius sp. TE539]|nr:hypothetical protein DQW77_15735 [Roseovarius sp. TE539]